ncbi:uncharacterized protein BO88DRAFT_455539 [Aspergillus vadensis CBS 113365]|uniref:Ankyrin n=1 Tax=Aspergillus vadensis (strain CBS 113365 / IMI 142717 / IBT 24658) TaxID=1448311 RepID=A0A319CFC9_ASPVC|nr:hypothetical protein BO88DRAFT_455539 [Aspergillus vadensis CBS 113365]PYH67052.1 hypothetical protein BO88DRAFT_455539 [Aspergillus vadensis CBS 113365]
MEALFVSAPGRNYTRGHSDVAMRLLNCVPRLDVNVRIYLGDSALSLAALQGHVDVVARLLEIWQTDRNGADSGCWRTTGF